MRCRGWDDNVNAKPRCEQGQHPVGGKHLSSSSPEQCPPVPAGGRSLAHLLLSMGGEQAPGLPGGPEQGGAGSWQGAGCRVHCPGQPLAVFDPPEQVLQDPVWVPGEGRGLSELLCIKDI